MRLTIKRVNEIKIQDRNVFVVYEVFDELDSPYYPVVNLSVRDQYSIFDQISDYVTSKKKEQLEAFWARDHAEFYVGQEWSI